MNFICFHKYYIDVLSTKDILAINNLLFKSWLINGSSKALLIAIIMFKAKLYLLINILFYCGLCGSVAKRIENETINMLSLW